MTKHCSRCKGYGIIKSYSNVIGGICFKCNGKNTRGNWKEEEKKIKKERYEKTKRIENLRKSISAKEILIENLEVESNEEMEIYKKWNDQLAKMKLEYNELIDITVELFENSYTISNKDVVYIWKIGDSHCHSVVNDLPKIHYKCSSVDELIKIATSKNIHGDIVIN